MVLIGLGGFLVASYVIMALAAAVVSVIDGFKESTVWGIVNIAGALLLGFIPNLIFALMDIKHRHVPLTLFVGSILPLLLGVYLLVVGSFVQLIQ